MRNERPNSPTYVYLRKDENVLAYCSECETPVFVGNDQTEIKKAILKRRVASHMEFFNGRHNIDVVFPRKTTNNIIEGKDFIKPRFVILEVKPSSRSV